MAGGRTTRPVPGFLLFRRRAVSVVTLGNAAKRKPFSTVDTLITGSGDDTINLTRAIDHGSINLVEGSDTLTSGDAMNAATVADDGTIIGGAAPIPSP